ncbi:hypothetical protein ACIRU8_14395 [Streptomyces sp. NPDC101175]|uniref:hypothetical protein n=1 Tax=Streptomyces sp. NPDC101175 TaxID=3366123 RepID=UPI003832D110
MIDVAQLRKDIAEAMDLVSRMPCRVPMLVSVTPHARQRRGEARARFGSPHRDRRPHG